MATTPTQNAVPSESPRDLKFNAGKIDEFVTSLAMQYIDRFGNAHYTIEGLRWLAQQAISQYGWIPVGTFQDGAALTLPNQILKDTSDGEYYRWDGPLPKVVPAGSTPASTGGTGVGAWISVGDSTLRALLASATGAKQIGTNHRGALQQDMDVIDIRTPGQPISALLAAGRDVEIDTHLSSTAVTQAETSVSGHRGGSIVATKGSVGLNLSADNLSANGLNIAGAGDVTPTDTTPTYLLRYGDDKRGAAIINSRFKLATMGVHIRKAFDAIVFNSRSEDMVYHPSLNAGGYAILTEGAENTLILGGSSKGTANDRHAIYISNEPTLRPNKDVRIIGYRADYTGANTSGVDGTRNMPMINVRIVDGLIIDDCQLRGGGQGIIVLNNLGVPQRVTITNNQVIDITKASADDGCTGISTTFTTGNSPIAGMLIANNQISVKRASGVTDGARRPIGISLSNVRQAVVSSNIVSSPPDSYPLVLDSCRDVNINNLIALPGTGTGTALEVIRFEGVSQDISVSQIAYPNRPGVFSGLDNVTNLTVDYPRKLTIVSVNGTITSSDPNSLMSSVSATGTGEITIVFKAHVTTQALDNATLRGNRIAGPYVFANRTAKSLVCSIYTTSGGVVPLSTSTVGIDIVLFS